MPLVALLLASTVKNSRAETAKGKGKFTVYYVAEVKPVESGGVSGKVKIEDKWQRYRLSPADGRKANLEGSVSVEGPEGKKWTYGIVKVGVWVH